MKNNLLSGQPYNLNKLFDGDRKIIIPDLQRDYCWGDKKHGGTKIELVSGFFDSLFETFEKEPTKELQLGMIYAYENPINHVQLCDGQQRITTLYLLMGMLYKKLRLEFINNWSEYDDKISRLDICKKLRNNLISKFEYKRDDKEPYLQYAIRESTLYFLSDLVCRFFLNGDIEVKDIKKCSWYFSEYNLDPTIQSMISALEIIEKKLIGKDLSGFSDFILQKVELLYFDMKDRQHGEEMFVIINTTGEALTPTENLKPILIGNIKEEERKSKSDIWENWEKWFWQNKLGNENEADQGLNEFFIWYWQLKLGQESDYSSGKQEKLSPIKLFKERPKRKNEGEGYEYSTITIEKWEKAKSLDEIEKYFIQFQTLCGFFKDIKFKNIINQIDKDAISPRQLKQKPLNEILLPLWEFMVKFPYEKEKHYFFLRRLRKNYFDGLRNERNQNFVDWRHILEIIEKIENAEDVFTYTSAKESFKKIPNINSKILNWYNEEEQFKTNLKIIFMDEIEKWEDHPDFMGDLSPLFKVTDYTIDIDKLEKYYKGYERFISPNEEVELKNEIFLIRICSDFDVSEFTSGGKWYRCIEKKLDYKIF